MKPISSLVNWLPFAIEAVVALIFLLLKRRDLYCMRWACIPTALHTFFTKLLYCFPGAQEQWFLKPPNPYPSSEGHVSWCGSRQLRLAVVVVHHLPTHSSQALEVIVISDLLQNPRVHGGNELKTTALEGAHSPMLFPELLPISAISFLPLTLRWEGNCKGSSVPVALWNRFRSTPWIFILSHKAP